MKRVSGIKGLQAHLNRVRKAGKTIGFVPTMGAFHAGHLSLMHKAQVACDYTVVSLFVNPLQFGPNEDFFSYPRAVASDCKKAAAVGVDLLWTPSEAELFPKGFKTNIDVGPIAHRWEGAARPGHFQGVATLVAKLLLLVRPDRLYLGRKDFQQTRVIAQLVNDLHLGLKIRICPTVREKDGLAMSSRNQKLSPEERRIAPLLYRALMQAKTALGCGERRSPALLKKARSVLLTAPKIQIDYLTLCDPIDLAPLRRIEGEAVLLAAVRLGSVRLIDNVVLHAEGHPNQG